MYVYTHTDITYIHTWVCAHACTLSPQSKQKNLYHICRVWRRIGWETHRMPCSLCACALFWCARWHTVRHLSLVSLCSDREHILYRENTFYTYLYHVSSKRRPRYPMNHLQLYFLPPPHTKPPPIHRHHPINTLTPARLLLSAITRDHVLKSQCSRAFVM